MCLSTKKQALHVRFELLDLCLFAWVVMVQAQLTLILHNLCNLLYICENLHIGKTPCWLIICGIAQTFVSP